MCPPGYYMIISQSKEPKLFRYELVRFAKKHGVKPAARAFKNHPQDCPQMAGKMVTRITTRLG